MSPVTAYAPARPATDPHTHGRASGGDRGAGIARRADGIRRGVLRVLSERDVHLGLDAGVHPVLFEIRDDADDRHPRIFVDRPTEFQTPADRILAAKIHSGE